MEIKINKEIRGYTESMFFGLSLRQCVFSAFAVAAAVAVFFICKPVLGLETASWVCVMAAAPFAMLGFIKYNGMTAEKLAWAWLKSEVLTPSRLMYKPVNLMYEIMKPLIDAKTKGVTTND